MKTLIARHAFGSTVSNLNTTLPAQYDYGFPVWGDNVIFTNQDVRFPNFKTVQFYDAFTHGKINVAKVMNYIFGYATEFGYDYVLLLDVDSVVVGQPKFAQFSQLSVHYSKPSEVHPLTEFKLKLCSHMLLGREIFSNLRWNDQFYGYGYEDTDFIYNRLWYAGFRSVDCGLTTVHLFHPLRDSDEDRAANILRNRQLCYDELLLADVNNPDPDHERPTLPEPEQEIYERWKRSL